MNDTFSYTFYDKPFFNQNWLTHVYLWLLYDKVGPGAVIVGTWAVAASTFVLVLLATWLRTRSWIAAFIAGAGAGIATRDWVSARPATIQFFLLAACWLCLTALQSQGARRRWWPIGLLFVTFVLWTNAHGSFDFGYGLVGLFVWLALAALLGQSTVRLGWPTGVAVLLFFVELTLPISWKVRVGPAVMLVIFVVCAWGTRLTQSRAAISFPQTLGLIGVVVVTVLLALLLGPYHVENFTHQFKVAESEAFRQIGEWHNPFSDLRTYPPVYRFWMALPLAVLCFHLRRGCCGRSRD